MVYASTWKELDWGVEKYVQIRFLLVEIKLGWYFFLGSGRIESAMYVYLHEYHCFLWRISSIA